MKIAVDMSSIMWTCLNAGTDPEGIPVDVGDKRVIVPTCMYGYEAAINHIVKVLETHSCVPSDLILVFEGKDSKRRRVLIDNTYKANREKRVPQAYEEFNKLKELLGDTLGKLGAIAVSQDGIEGDDVLGWLAKHTEEKLVIDTYDNDLIVLNGVNPQGVEVEVSVNNIVGVNKYGGFDFKLVTLYKALVGDSSDGIKGVPGFGPAAWMSLNVAYGDDGCFELMDLIRKGNKNEVATIARDNNCKLLKKIVDSWDFAYRCLKLTTIHDEWVHTPRVQLQWKPGMVHGEVTDERLKKWSGKSWLITADNYEEAFARLAKQMPYSRDPAFDIETSQPEESDEWLAAQGKDDGVDQLGSTLTGFSITFGRNSQYTYYVCVDHKDTANITMSQARKMIELTFVKKPAIQNTFFEFCVLHEAQDEDGSLWREHWNKYGYSGFLPNAYDTKLEGSYVNENMKLGLKERSKHYLNYAQQTYEETVTKIIDGVPVKHKMNQLTGQEVFSYGADDTITTSALHNFYKLHMQLDHHWHVYLAVELFPAYLHAKSFVDGMPVSIAKSKQLEKKDDAIYDAAWAVVRKYLIEQGWAGTIPPVYTKDLTAKQIKEAYAIVMGLDADDEDDEEDEDGSKDEQPEKPKDAFLSTRVRTPSKLSILLKEAGQEELSNLVNHAIAGKPDALTAYVQERFSGEPKIKFSPKQLGHLMYDVMKVPVRLRGKLTATMKAKGQTEGNPKANELAMKYAMNDGTPEQKEVLESLLQMRSVMTKRSFYYSKYPNFVHWKTGRIHGSHNQCATNTRRASASGPNTQQLPKNEKVEGQKPEFRQVVVPHKKNAVIVSMDFEQQELRIIADYSQDTNLVACYVGDNKKDMHILTAAGILQKKFPKDGWSYDRFVAEYGDTSHSNYAFLKKWRGKGKTVNFATEYGAEAEKISQTLMVDEDEAQVYIDARREAFPQVEEWKEQVKEDAKQVGYVRTKLGAMRHLAELFNSDDRYIASKAERQAVNMKVQGSAAEMTKLAEARMWQAGLLEKFDCVYIGPIHDEVVWSVAIEDLFEWAKVAHPCMVAPYADMRIPITSSISFGPDFGRQIEIGNEVTKEAFDKGLKQLEEMLA